VSVIACYTPVATLSEADPVDDAELDELLLLLLLQAASVMTEIAIVRTAKRYLRTWGM
jgi:hypothetical protein